MLYSRQYGEHGGMLKVNYAQVYAQKYKTLTMNTYIQYPAMQAFRDIKQHFKSVHTLPESY